MCAAEGGRGKATTVNWKEQLLGQRAKRAENWSDLGGRQEHRGAAPATWKPGAAQPAPRLGATRGLFWQGEELLFQPARVTIHRESQTHASLTTLQPLSLIFFNK